MTIANALNINSPATVGTGEIVLNTGPVLVAANIIDSVVISSVVDGVAGNGFLECRTQSVNPTAGDPLSFRLFSNSFGYFSWVNFDGFISSLSSTLTDNRVYTLQDSSDTFVMRDTTDTLTNKTFDTAASNILQINGTEVVDILGPAIPTGIVALTKTDVFTPILTFDGDDTGITYNTQYGKYSQTGNVVNFKIVIVLSSKGTATGSAAIYGMPIGNGSFITVYNNIVANNVTFLGNNQVCAYTSDTDITNKILHLIYPQTGSTYGFYTDAEFTDTSEIYMSGTFFTD